MTADEKRERQRGLRGVQAWPTMFFLSSWEEHELHHDSIVACLRGLQARQRRPVASGVAEEMKSSRGLQEGSFDLLREPHEGLMKLRGFIESTVAAAAAIANDRPAAARDLAVSIPDSWYHITNEGGFHDAHWHHGCSWCGVYYVQVGDSGARPGGGAPNGGSRFYCPLLTGGQYRDFGNRYLSGTLDVPLENGLLLLFPSFLLHSGLPYSGGVDRIVIAFNAQVHVREGTPTAVSIQPPGK